MRKLFVFNMVSADGYFAGPNGQIDWHNVDKEFNAFAAKQLDEIDTLLFGRVTYQLMASYWPTEAAKHDDPVVATKMNNMHVVVATHTPTEPKWKNTRFIADNVTEEIRKLKEQPGKDIAIFGSSVLSVSLLEAGLVDECRIMVNPVFIGEGRPLFAGLSKRVTMHLASSTTFASGNVLLAHKIKS